VRSRPSWTAPPRSRGSARRSIRGAPARGSRAAARLVVGVPLRQEPDSGRVEEAATDQLVDRVGKGILLLRREFRD
jgi:hypothetical protein